MDLISILSSLDFYKIPLIQPPAGTQSNFASPQSIAPTAEAIVYASWAVMLPFLALRVYSRTRVTCSFGIDDFLCIFAALCVTAESGVTLSLLGNPLGFHGWDVPVIEYFTLEKPQLAVLSLYLAAAIFLKASLLVFDLRIFQPKRGARIVLWLSIAVIVVFNLAILIVSDTICGDLTFTAPDNSTLIQLLQQFNTTEIPAGMDATEYVYKAIGLWVQNEVHENRCGNAEKVISVIHGVFNFTTDFYVLAISIGLTLTLRLKARRKAAVCGIFLIGLLACICSILSTYYRILLFKSDDITWVSALSIAIGIAEHNIGIICSCMPAMPVLYKSCVNSPTWTRISSFWTQRKLGSTSDMKETDPSQSRARRGLDVSIPRGTITGFRTMFWRSTRTQAPAMTEMSEYMEVASIRDEYHTYIKGRSNSVSQSTSHKGETRKDSMKQPPPDEWRAL